MSLQPSSSNTPIITTYTPRGRPWMATIGVLVALAGVVLWGLVSQGVISLPGLSAIQQAISPGTSTTSNGPAPIGSAPADFKAYRDPQHRFALYISQSWAEGAATLTINGQNASASGFTPTGSVVPNWRLAFLSAPLSSNSVSAITSVSDMLTAEGDKNVTPTNGPQNVTVGTASWSRIDLTAQNKNGLNIHVVTFTRPVGSGAVLVVEEAATLSFSTTEQQDFTPMLNSLNLQS